MSKVKQAKRKDHDEDCSDGVPASPDPKKHQGKNGQASMPAEDPSTERKDEDKPFMVPGCVCHLEFPASNFARVRVFFERTFGWSFNPWGDSYLTFVGAHKKCLQGGVFKARGPIKPNFNGVTCNLLTENMRAKLAEIHENGGAVHRPMTLIAPGIGSHAGFIDTEGNVWSLYSREEDAEEVAPPIEQKVHFHSLSPSTVFKYVSDGEAQTKVIGMAIDMKAEEMAVISSQYISGRVIEVVPDRKLVMSWRGRDFPAASFTVVTIELESDGVKGTNLKLTHEHVPKSKEEDLRKGWYTFYWNKFGEGDKQPTPFV